MNEDTVISFENFSFKYFLGSEWAVRNINLEISKGEFIIFTGANGSGKSSLVYGILGLIPHFYTGEFKGDVFTNRMNTKKTPISTIITKIGYVPQRIENTIITPFVYTELAFPLEYQNITKEEFQKRVIKISNQLKIEELLPKNTHEISKGERQKVGFGSATINIPEIIIADEPLANLDKKNRERIIKILSEYKTQGKTIIISTHDYEQYLNLASRVIFLEKGIVIKDSITQKNRKEEKEKSVKIKQNKERKKEKILEIKNLNFEYNDAFRLNDINFSISRGEIVGIIGDNGSGKTTFLKLLLGLLVPKKGEITILKRKFKELNWKEISKIFGFVFQDPDLQFFTEEVIEEITFISNNLKRNFDEKEIVSLIQEMNLSNYLGKNPLSLSYGERKKLAFISSFYHNPEILLLDEITAGLDLQSKEVIATKIKAFSKQGGSTIISSHDLEWLDILADRILFLEEGRFKNHMEPERGSFNE